MSSSFGIKTGVQQFSDHSPSPTFFTGSSKVRFIYFILLYDSILHKFNTLLLNKYNFWLEQGFLTPDTLATTVDPATAGSDWLPLCDLVDDDSSSSSVEDSEEEEDEYEIVHEGDSDEDEEGED